MEVTENSIQAEDENPENPIEESPSGISIILFEDAAHQGKLVADARAWFQQQKTPCEFIVVSTQGPRLAPLCGTQQMASVQSFDVAVRSARFEHVAVIDAVYRFDPSHWSVVNPINRTEAFRSWCYAPSRAPGSRKILVWIYCQIVRFLLGVNKNRLSPGMITFTKSQLTNIDLARLDHTESDSVAQLLSMANSRGRKVEEHRCELQMEGVQWTKSNSADPHLPKSKSIKASIKRSLRFWFSQLAFPARLPKTQHSASSPIFAMVMAAILLLANIVLFTNSSYPLFEPDEARNAQLAINIVESGQWTQLTLMDEPYWDKPPLLAWMTAISYKCFGISEWATRLPSIVTSLLLFAFMIIAGTKLLGLRVATMGSAALLLAWGFAFQTRYVTMDALLTFFTTSATLGIAVGVCNDGPKKYSRSWLIGSGIAIGLGVLAKGPVCIVLTAPPIIAWMFLNRKISKEAIRATVKFVSIPAVLISAPWFISTMAMNPGFAWHFFWKHHVVRFSEAFNHHEPIWYYLPILWLFMFPASILLPRVTYVMMSSKEKHRQLRTPVHALMLMSALWIVGFFSLSQCKLPAYILPAFPMIALLTGVVFNAEFKKPSLTRSRFDRLPKRIAIGLSTLILVAGVVSVYQFGNTEFSSVLMILTAVIASVLILVRYPLKRSTSRRTSWLATSAIGMIFVFVGVNQLVPSMAKDRSILLSLAQDTDNRETLPVIYFGRDSFASRFYLPNRSVIQIDEEDFIQLESVVIENPQAMIVASDANIEKLKETFGEDISIKEAPGRHTFYSSVTSPERVASAPDGGENLK